ncbi:hypothetical protein ROHU_011780 [Labeo rohita]|uniref:Uncharacterized protein n=1 Tax=Labeo rohita TaxID=84645 RepID=A0A498LK05_LABRO|nr:hypothetical protein ROHU_011780 [Labeo rohita]
MRSQGADKDPGKDSGEGMARDPDNIQSVKAQERNQQRKKGQRPGQNQELRLHLPSLSLPISSSSIDGCQRCAEPALPSPANRAKVSAPRIIVADRPPSPPAADG